MPELAEVEIIRRNLASWWAGQTATEVRLHDEKLLTRGTSDALTEALLLRPVAFRRRGKYLWTTLSNGSVVLFHFRMTGKITREDTPEPRFARLSWLVGESWLCFKDSRRLGHVELFERGELAKYEPLLKMGPEPSGLTLEAFESGCKPGRRLKDALLDQAVVAGVGNIAVSELFWRIQIAPDARRRDVDRPRLQALVDELPAYFDELIATQQADEIRYINSGGDRDANNPFAVYARESQACPRCGDPIERMAVGGRSSYFCPRCQATTATP